MTAKQDLKEAVKEARRILYAIAGSKDAADLMLIEEEQEL